MRKRRILVVDDSLTSREVFRDELQELGYEVVLACSAEEALDLPSWQQYDAYLVDIRLPGLSGFDLLHHIKEIRPRALVILVTQFEHSRPDRAIKAYEDVWFFRKPADIYTLSSVLKNAFEAEELRRDVERMRSLAVGIKSVGQVRDLDQEFKVLLHLAGDSLSADAGAVYLLPEPGDKSEVLLQVGVELPAGAVGSRFPVGGVLQRCLDRQEAVMVENVRLNRMPELAKLFPEVRRIHVLAIPLTAGHKLIGVLCLYRDAERSAFGEKDQAMARLYAATAAVALENMRLSDQARSSYQRQLEAQRELIQSRKLSSLGQVTAGISHEIRNPLTVILGNVDLIRKKSQPGEFDVYLDRIRGQCDRVSRLVTDLKAVYHPGEAQRGRFRLRDLVEEALVLAPPPEEVEAKLVLPDLDDLVEGDFSQLLHVLINLLSNSYQAMGAGPGKVFLELEPGERDLILVVRDSGPGIPEDSRQRIFEPFFTTKGSAGTGLGLWISATILRSHGGSLEAVQHPEGGACFWLRFPREGSVAVSTAPPAPAGESEPAGGAASLITVLVVDDEQGIREYLSELLESEGYQVRAVSELGEAERILESQSIDLVVLDENLSGGLGSEFYVRKVRPVYNLPAVLFTGSDRISMPELLRLGFAAVVQKPARGGKILEAVRRALLEHVRPAEARS